MSFEAKDAERLFELYTGDATDQEFQITIPDVKAAALLGKVLEIVYRGRIDGMEEDYVHEFKNAFMLGAKEKGVSMLIIVGDFDLTKHGIKG